VNVVGDQPDYAALKREFDQGLISDENLASRLSDGWTASYRHRTAVAELVEIDQGELTYLFDLAGQRLIGAYGRAVLNADRRPGARMRGFPLPASRNDLVRGHLVAHSLGGGTDINLIPQSAALNIGGPWRRLERLAHANPGCFLAIEATYEDDTTQTPAQLTYLVATNGVLTYERFRNT
jgi:hypothetical protein